MTEEELRNEPWTVERAIGTIGAFIEGGDELGLVSEDEAATAYNVLCDALATVTAERDALQAKLAAVPIGPIRRWYENSNPQLMEYEFIADVETDAEFIEAWLETQVTP